MTAPRARDTDELLERFERYRDVKGTLELFDALCSGNAYAVRDALMHALKHPMAEDVVAWLARRGVPRPLPPSNVEVLEKRGIEDVDAFLVKKDKEIAELRRALELAQGAAQRAQNAASGYAAASLVLGGVALLGWLAALGVLPFVAEGPTPLRELDGQEQGDGAEEGRGR